MRVRENVTVTDENGKAWRYSPGDTVDPEHESMITNPNVIDSDRHEALSHVGTLPLIEIARMLGIDDWAVATRDALCEQIAQRDDAADVITLVLTKFVDEGRQVERVDASDTGLQVVEQPSSYPSGYDEQPAAEPVVIDVDLSDTVPGAMPGTDAQGPTPTTETISVEGEQPQRSQETSPQPEQTESASLQATPQEGVQDVSPEAAAAATPEQAIEGLKTSDDLKGFAALNGIDVGNRSKPEALRSRIVDELTKRGPADTKVINVGGDDAASIE